MGGTLLFSGCLNRQSPAEEMFEKLEKVVEIEQTFEDQQKPLVQLEKQEKELYGQIIEMNLQEYDKVVQLADEAISISKKRNELLDLERKSIEESQAEFEQVPEIYAKIDDLQLKEQAKGLNDLMQERYRTHEKLYESYVAGLGYDIELYNMFKNEEVTVDQLGEQINKVNAAYEEVLSANDQFNQLTDQYNEKKYQFYQAAGLNVETNGAK